MSEQQNSFLKETFNGLLSTVYQVDNDGVASLYNEDGDLKEDAKDYILNLDKERIAKLKPDTKKIFDDGYKKAQGETLSKFEKDLIAKFNIKSERKGLELVEDLVSSLSSSKFSKDDEESIKKSKVYIDTIEKLNAEKAEIETNWKTQFETFKSNVEKEKVFGVVSNEALALFENLKPILPEDGMKAKNLKQIFLNELQSYRYEVRDGKTIIQDADGNDITDAHGNRIKFDVLVKQTAEKYFDFYKSDSKEAPPKTPINTEQSTFEIKSEADYIRLVAQATTPEQKLALRTAYNKFKNR